MVRLFNHRFRFNSHRHGLVVATNDSYDPGESSGISREALRPMAQNRAMSAQDFLRPLQLVKTG